MGGQKVVFTVESLRFEVPIPNLRPSLNQNSLLLRLVDKRANELAQLDGDLPIDVVVVGANVDLFPYILSIHRYGGCAIPPHISREDVLQEARKVFHLAISAESIVQEGDAIRDSWGGIRTHQAADHFDAWSVDEVCDWLKSIHGGRFCCHVDTFRTNLVDGRALVSSTDDTLKSCGISDPKTRKLLLVAICDAPKLDKDIIGESTFASKTDTATTGDVLSEHEHEQQDAAALNLNKIFGENGTTQMFTDAIGEWRKQHLIENGNKTGDPVLGMPKNGILVASRVRPLLLDGPDKAAIDLGDFEAVSAHGASPPKMTVHSCGINLRGLVEHKSFTIHRTLDTNCSELDVFELAKPHMDASVKHHVHVTLLCYGQTGSGKTHSVSHLAKHICRHIFVELGLDSVALEAFELAGGAKGLVQHGSHIYSLITDDKPELAALEGPDGAVHVGGNNAVVRDAEGQLNLDHCIVASSPAELEDIFRAAEARRCSKDTHRNAESSRTHAFYRFHILKSGEPQATGSCIQLVDLAGSESNKDCLYHDKQRIDERAQINASLMALCSCIQKHAEGASYVPFRSSKLTQLLRPCFMKNENVPKGIATVLFLACVSPLASDTQQSIRTLGFAQKLANVPSTGVKKPMPRAFLAIKDQLCKAVASGDIYALRAAVVAAKNNGAVSACGADYRRAAVALDKLEAQQEQADQ